jgi:hypothetical protein
MDPSLNPHSKQVSKLFLLSLFYRDETKLRQVIMAKDTGPL